MALTRYPTAGSVINDAARDMGLTSADIADPFASSDANIRQLVGNLVRAGRRLAREQQFRHLVVEVTLDKTSGSWVLPTGWSVAAGTTDDLIVPADFVKLVDQSSWNRSTRLPLGGPLTPQLWEYRKSSPVGSIFAEWRQDTNRFRLLPTPLGNYLIAVEYYSRAWVTPAASGLGDGNTLGMAGADAPVAAGDFVLFDPNLITAAVKLEYRKHKGLDTADAQEEFDRELGASLDAMASGRVLGLTGPKANPHLIDIMNLPDTGFGR